MEDSSGDDLLRAADSPLPIGSVDIAELNKRIWCQGLTALDRGKWERSFLRRDGSKVDPRKMLNARGSLLALCIIKGEKDRTLRYGPENVETLVRLSAVIVEPIYDLCRKLSGIGEKDVEDLEQRSAEAGGSGSSSS